MQNFFLVAPKAVVLFVEVRLVKEGEVGGTRESIVDLDIVDLGMIGKVVADTVSFSSVLGVGYTRANIQMVQILDGMRQCEEGWGGELRC